jgi:hypothetical protein
MSGIASQNKINMSKRKWIREASMRRLSQIVKDKTALLESAKKLRLNTMNVEDIVVSGLNPAAVQQLERWVEGNLVYLSSLQWNLFFNFIRKIVRPSMLTRIVRSC